MLRSDGRCFVCGKENSGGLQLDFSFSEDGWSAETVFLPDEKYQGWPGIVHGGMIMTVLDEVMAKAAVQRGYNVVTGEMTVKLKNPAKTGEQLRCRGAIETIKKRIIYAGASATREDGTVIAEATAKLVIIA
jgi:uncharacterized protein (TIGR00369 family)